MTADAWPEKPYIPTPQEWQMLLDRLGSQEQTITLLIDQLAQLEAMVGTLWSERR